MKRYDVVVAGAGIMGLSAAYAMLAQGAGSVLVLEASEPGAGTTGASAAVFRLWHDVPELSRLAVESDAVVRRWESEGVSFGLVRSGLLWSGEPGQVAAIAASLAELGADAFTPGHTWLAHRQPFLPNSSRAMLVEGAAGYADPRTATRSLVRALREAGAEIRTGEPVTEVVARGGRLVGVQTARERVLCDCLIVATGAEAPALSGQSLPVRRLAVRLAQFPLSAPHPGLVHIDLDRLLLMKFDGSRCTVGISGYPGEGGPRTARESSQGAYLAETRKLAAEVYPPLARATGGICWESHYDVTPDGLPIVGALREITGLYVATGLNGVGFKLAPGLADRLADAIARGADTRLAPFSPERFAVAGRGSNG